MEVELDYLDFINKCFVSGSCLNIPIEKSFGLSTKICFNNRALGNLKITTGMLVACDIFDIDSVNPFDILFPIGNFPIELSLMSVNGDERIAFSRILFSNEHTVRIEIATRQQLTDESERFSVDSATACYFDTNILDDLEQIIQEDDDWLEKIEKKIKNNYEPTRSWYMFEYNIANIAFFTAGFGDGMYKSYITYDAKNNVTQLITDFNLFVI